MERYPDYRFACSQAQQYAWIRDRAPGLWARIRARVARGPVAAGRRHVDRARLQPAGRRVARAPVPATASASSSASSARRADGVLEPRRVRLQRPAPAAHARRRDQRLPHPEAVLEPLHPPEHHTFRWVGIDGSSVLAHFPPADTYNAEATVARAAPLRRATSRTTTARRASLLRVRLGRRRRRADARDMLETLARVGGPAGRPAHGDRPTPRRSSARSRRRRTTGRRSSASSTSSTTAAPTRARRGPSGRAARAERAAARRRAARRRRRPRSARRLAGRGARRARGRRCCSTTSTTSSPGSSIGEVHARAERDLAEVEAAAAALRDAALAALGGGLW